MDGIAVEILIVEDSDTDLELALRALTQAKVANRIEVARDGAEALDFLFSQGAFAGRPADNPQLVLLDLKLPMVDGLEVLRTIKQNSATRTIPVVMLTAHESDSDRAIGFAAGATQYLTKPFGPLELIDTIRGILAHS